MRKTILVPFVIVLCLLLTGKCGAQESITPSESSFQVDYECAELFETALNAGVDVEGKVVKFVINKYVPDSILGKNCWAGEHLNFISSVDLDVKPGDTIIGKVSKTSKTFFGSWKIKYEVLDILSTGIQISEEATTAIQPAEATEEGEIAVPHSNDYYKGRKYTEVIEMLEQAGFTNIVAEPVYDFYFGNSEVDTVESIVIGGKSEFEQGSAFWPDTKIVVTYRMYYEHNPEKRTYCDVVYDYAFESSGKDGLRARYTSYYLFNESDQKVLYYMHTSAGSGKTTIKTGTYTGSLNRSAEIKWTNSDETSLFVKHIEKDRTYWAAGRYDYSKTDVKSCIQDIQSHD